MGEPKVSVILPTYNREQVLERAINSVLAQTYTHWELLVIDDGSTDNSRDLVEALASRGGRIRYLFQEHHGVARARNLGVHEAGAELLAFIDSDDVWFPQKLERQVAFMDSSDLDLLQCAREINVEPDCDYSALPHFCRELARSSEQLLAGQGIVAMNMLVKKSAVLQAGGFDESLITTQDLDLWLRLAKQAEIGLLDECLITCNKRSDGLMSRDLTQKVRDRITVFKRMQSDDHPAVDAGVWGAHIASHEEFLRKT